MNKQINEAIKLAVEIILGGAFIAVIALFGYVSNTGYNTYATNKAEIQVLKDAKDMNEYSDIVVNGVDVVDIIVTLSWDNRFIIDHGTANDRYVFPSIFDLSPEDTYIRVKNSLLAEGYKASNILGTKQRTKEALTKLLDVDIQSNYKSTLLYKSGTVIGIKFTKG